MHKLLRLPIWTPFFGLFGMVLVRIGGEARARGFVTFIPEPGPQQIISATHRPGLYWLLSSGAISLGVLCLGLSACAAYLLIRSLREEGFGQVFQAPLFGKMAFAVGALVMLAVLIVGKCSRQ